MNKSLYLLVLLLVGCQKVKDEPYRRTSSKCEVVVGFEMCCGAFADRYMLTEKGRYLINDNSNIIKGDSLCEYSKTYSGGKTYTELSIQGKDEYIRQ